MGWFSSSKNELPNSWEALSSVEQLEEALKGDKPVAVLKHSTRCGISGMIKTGLEREWDIEPEALRFLYLDLLAYRSISDHLASISGVRHESPQVLIFKDGNWVFDASHSEVTVAGIRAAL